MFNQPKGSAVIEVLLSLSLAAVLVVVMGNLIGAVRRMEVAQDYRQRALSYVEENIELVTSLQHDLFVCVSPTAGPGTCLNSDGQSCSLQIAYNSCWTEYGYGLNNQGPLHLAPSGSSWQLVDGIEQVPTDADFNRFIMIENVDGDANRKKVTVEVFWQEKGQNKSLSMATLLTGWSNITP